MDLTGEQMIDAPRAKVWAALNDPGILKASLPGCDDLEKTSDTEFTATMRASVGPVKAKFSGAVRLENIDAPNGYRLVGEGKGGAAGFAKGQADVRLEDAGQGTRLSYSVKANVGGQLARIGGRLIDATAKKLSDEFFTNFRAQVENTGQETVNPLEDMDAVPTKNATPDAPQTPEDADPPIDRRGLAPAIWGAGLIVAVLVFLWYVAG